MLQYSSRAISSFSLPHKKDGVFNILKGGFVIVNTRLLAGFLSEVLAAS